MREKALMSYFVHNPQNYIWFYKDILSRYLQKNFYMQFRSEIVGETHRFYIKIELRSRNSLLKFMFPQYNASKKVYPFAKILFQSMSLPIVEFTFGEFSGG